MFSRQSPRLGFLLIVIGSVSWGTVGVANQVLYSDSATNALSLTFLRLVIAAPLFFLASWLTLGRRFFHIERRDLRMMMLMGVMIAGSQACYVAAVAAAGVSVATLIAICAAPVIVAMLSALTGRERATRLTLLALAAALSGTALLVATRSRVDVGSVSLAGAAFALLCACGYAGFVFCGRFLSARCQPIQISTVAFGTGALVLLVCAASTHLALAYSPSGWLILLYLGAVPTALGYGLFQVGIRSLPATIASIVTMCEPLTAAILAWILFHEALSPLGLLGGGLLLAAMAIILVVPQEISRS